MHASQANGRVGCLCGSVKNWWRDAKDTRGKLGSGVGKGGERREGLAPLGGVLRGIEAPKARQAPRFAKYALSWHRGVNRWTVTQSTVRLTSRVGSACSWLTPTRTSARSASPSATRPGTHARRRQLLPRPDAAGAAALGGGAGPPRALYVRLRRAAAAGDRGEAHRGLLAIAPSG